MSVFDLHSQVLADYRHFVQSFFTVADDRARGYVERALVAEARLWPDFLLQVSPSGRKESVGVRSCNHTLENSVRLEALSQAANT